MQCRLVIVTNVLGQPIGPIFKSQVVQAEDGTRGYPETSARNYQSTLHKIAEERRSPLHHRRSLKSHNWCGKTDYAEVSSSLVHSTRQSTSKVVPVYAMMVV